MVGCLMTDPFTSEVQFRDLALTLVGTAHRAGRAIMAYYGKHIEISQKNDASPVTAADREAEQIILHDLAKTYGDIPVIAEEAASEGKIPDIEKAFFLVDPLDGTKEFIEKRSEFTVNIALVVDCFPCFGLVFAPALGALYITLSPQRAYEARLDPQANLTSADGLDFTEIRTRPPDMQALTVVASRSHMDEKTKDFLAHYNINSTSAHGSSVKFCSVARGDADLYPRFGRTMEWDTAAGHAVLAAAGGSVQTTDGAPFVYGKKDQGFANPGFIAWGRKTAP